MTDIILTGDAILQVFCSDLGRAQDTLLQIGYKTAKCFDARLRERDYGTWSGKPWNEYKDALKAIQGASNGVTFDQSLPGVESNQKLQDRYI